MSVVWLPRGVRRHRLTERQDGFTMDLAAPIWKDCVFAGLGAAPGGLQYTDSLGWRTGRIGNHGTLTGYTGAGNTPPDRWSRALGRAVLGASGDSSQYVSISSYLNVPYLTLSAWAYPTSNADYRYVWSKDPDNSNRCWALGHTSGGSATWYSLVWDNAGTLYQIAAGTVAFSAWSHIAMTFDGAYLRLFVNGASVGTPQAVTGTVQSKDVYPMLGTHRANYWAGSYADPCAWTRALSLPEISLLADPSRSIDYDGALVWPRGRSQVWFGATTTTPVINSYGPYEVVLPASNGDEVGTLGATGGTTPYKWYKVSETLV